MTEPNVSPDPLAIDRLRFVADALRQEDILSRRERPALQVDSIRATEEKRALESSVGRRALDADHRQRLLAQYADSFVALDERINAPEQAEQRSQEIKNELAQLRQQLQELQPAMSALETLQRWGTGR